MRHLNLAVAGMLLAAASAWADAPARPGTVNYVEGQVVMGAQTLDSKSAGLEMGDQSIVTLDGKVEILLTPGVFLRLGPNSSAKLLSAGLTDTQVQIEQGRAMVEVDELFHENHLRVLQGGFAIDLQKTGVYDFDAARNQVRVFDGEALATANGVRLELKGGHELNLAAGADAKSHGFDKKGFEDDLFAWSRLRSSYLAEANVSQARTYADDGGFFGAGWYWNPWFSAYTFIPGDGFFYNPFGWGFYSPWFAYRAPLMGYYGGYHSFAHYAPPAAGGYRGGAVPMGRVAMGRPMMAAPSFHSMGGFRGGRR